MYEDYLQSRFTAATLEIFHRVSPCEARCSLDYATRLFSK